MGSLAFLPVLESPEDFKRVSQPGRLKQAFRFETQVSLILHLCELGVRRKTRLAIKPASVGNAGRCRECPLSWT